MDNNEQKYADIFHMPHHVSTKRPQMSQRDRAAQFAPFAALTGHDEAIKETARLTDEKIELDESTLAILNDKLQIILDNLEAEPVVTITFFKADTKKAGGAYIEHSGVIRKVDDYERTVVFMDKAVIPIEDILDIQGTIFSSVFD